MQGVRRLVMFAVLATTTVMVAGCEESGYDFYLKGAQIEGAAEKGPCGIIYTEGIVAMIKIRRADIATCLRETEEALVYYQKAADKGYSNPDFPRTFERAKERRDRLDSMLKNIRRMQAESELEKMSP